MDVWGIRKSRTTLTRESENPMTLRVPLRERAFEMPTFVNKQPWFKEAICFYPTLPPRVVDRNTESTIDRMVREAKSRLAVSIEANANYESLQIARDFKSVRVLTAQRQQRLARQLLRNEAYDALVFERSRKFWRDLVETRKQKGFDIGKITRINFDKHYIR